MSPSPLPDESTPSPIDSMGISPDVMIRTQNNIIAQNAIRIVHLEAGIQQLSQENQQLRAMLAVLTVEDVPEEEAVE